MSRQFPVDLHTTTSLKTWVRASLADFALRQQAREARRARRRGQARNYQRKRRAKPENLEERAS
jgi:hypothetical protein